MKASIATGNWSTAATWGTITNTPTLHATAVTTLSATNIFTAGFTAPSLLDSCKGVWLYLSTPGTATINVTLQVATVDTVATKSISTTSGTVTTGASWYFFEFATPYTFLSLTANTYRFRINATGITNAPVLALDSGGTLPAYLAVDSRTGVPGAEATWIGGGYTVTLDGSRSVGSGADTAVLGTGTHRSIGFGLQVAQGGTLIWDTAASATLTCLGHFGVSGTGVVNMGTVATPYTSGQIATLTFNENGVSGNYGLHLTPTATFIAQGQPKSTTSLWKTFYTSGVGTAADPLITSTSVDWSVGDQIIVAGSVYNQAEYKFIITKNSATSYVLSNSAGGAEAAFANTHTTTHPILNLTRNVVINTTNTAQACYIVAGAGAVGLVNFDWVRFETVGVPGVSSKQGVLVTNTGAGTTATYSEFDYCVMYAPLFDGFAVTNTQTTQTFTGLITVRSANTSSISTGGGFGLLANSANKTFVDCYAMDWQGSGLFMSTPANCTFTRLNLWNCNGNNSTSAGGMLIAGVQLTYNSCVIQANRANGILLSSATKHTFNSLSCGDLFTNTTDLLCVTASTNIDVHFESPTFGSATLISGYTAQGTGSKITMQAVNANANDHRTYETNGTTRSCGTGLSDTNVRTSGSLSWRLAPENNTTGLQKEYKVLARAGQAVQILGFLQKNATFGSSTLTVELFLPGSLVADATQTMPNDTNFNPYSLAAVWTGSTDRLATVRITAISSTAGAYVYLDDINNGSTTNKFISLDMFDKGEISPIMFEQLGDAASVWAIATSTLTASGTTGFLLTKLLKLSNFLALK